MVSYSGRTFDPRPCTRRRSAGPPWPVPTSGLGLCDCGTVGQRPNRCARLSRCSAAEQAWGLGGETQRNTRRVNAQKRYIKFELVLTEGWRGLRESQEMYPIGLLDSQAQVSCGTACPSLPTPLLTCCQVRVAFGCCGVLTTARTTAVMLRVVYHETLDSAMETNC